MPTYPYTHNMHYCSQGNVCEQCRRSKVNLKPIRICFSKCYEFSLKIKLGILESFYIEKWPHNNPKTGRHGARRLVKMGERGCFEGPNRTKTEKYSFGQSKLVGEVIQYGRALLGDKEKSKILIKRNCGTEKPFMARMVDSILQRQIPEYIRWLRYKIQAKLLPMRTRSSFRVKIRQIIVFCQGVNPFVMFNFDLVLL
jgi:hypothetical protein